MIRRLFVALALLGGAVTAAQVAQAEPAAAYGWQSHWLPGQAWDYHYVELYAYPQACVALGSRGYENPSETRSYIEFMRNGGPGQLPYVIGRIVDTAADGRNVCSQIPRNTEFIRSGLVVIGGVNGLRHGYGLSAFPFQTYTPWMCFNCNPYAPAQKPPPPAIVQMGTTPGSPFPVIPFGTPFKWRVRETPYECGGVAWFSNPWFAQIQVTQGYCGELVAQIQGYSGVMGPVVTRHNVEPFSTVINVQAPLGDIACYLYLRAVGGQSGQSRDFVIYTDGRVL